MGTAPSSEIVREAPFRAPQGSVRQVALIPIVENFFPTPDCPLFKQLYEAYTDPSVRYYMRPSFDGNSGDLSRIPPIENSREDMHRLLLRHTAQGMYPSNAAVREAYEAGDAYRIRPVLSAVVFFYEGTSYVPEGSVRLQSANRGAASAFVKVIGVIGDACTLVNKADDPLIPFRRDDVLQIRTLIMKSAGDHNMSRVVLLAAYIYYYQCCRIIGLPSVPTMEASFWCFKTNIPFLCFLREMRDRTACVLGASEGSNLYIDAHCLHCRMSRAYTAKMLPAFACYYISFLNAKSEKRAMKQQAFQQQSLGGGAGRDRPGQRTNSLMGRPENHVGSVYSDMADDCVIATMRDAALESASSDNGNVSPKITYVVKGYITRPITSLSNWSHAANEVYVVCVDSTVSVVDRTSVEALDGPTHTPSLIHEDDPSEGIESVADSTASAVVEVLRVSRGDILTFYVPVKDDQGTVTRPILDVINIHSCMEDDDIIYTTPNIDALRICSTSSSSSLSSLVDGPSQFLAGGLFTDGAKEGYDAAEAFMGLTSPQPVEVCSTPACTEGKKGSWRVDSSVCVENVLLSLVRDECKLAREATEEDPGWVSDEASNSLVHDGSFYLWRFRRGLEEFFYGTVPKFANPNRQRTRISSAGVHGADLGQGRVSSEDSGVAKDAGDAVGSAIACGRSTATTTTTATTSSISIIEGRVPINTLPSSVYPRQRLNPSPSQSPQSQNHPPRAPLLTPTFLAPGSDVQQTYPPASAALPPAYSRDNGSSGQGIFVPFTANADQSYFSNSMYLIYPADMATMTAVGPPMMYTLMPSKQETGSMSEAQQHASLQPLKGFPSPRAHSHILSPATPSSLQRQATWGSLGIGGGHITSARGSSGVPYTVSSQGQLISLGIGGGVGATLPPQMSYAQSIPYAASQFYPQYVMVRDQTGAVPSAVSMSSQSLSYHHYPLETMAFRQ